MSYLTGRCAVCDGTARVHKDEDVECDETMTCAGCRRCRDCIDGKVVSMPGAAGALKRNPTVASGVQRKRPSRQPSGSSLLAGLFQAPDTLQMDSASSGSSIALPLPGPPSPGQSDPSLPPAPVLKRRPTIVEQTAAFLERPSSARIGTAPPEDEAIEDPMHAEPELLDDPEDIAAESEELLTLPGSVGADEADYVDETSTVPVLTPQMAHSSVSNSPAVSHLAPSPLVAEAPSVQQTASTILPPPAVPHKDNHTITSNPIKLSAEVPPALPRKEAAQASASTKSLDLANAPPALATALSFSQESPAGSPPPLNESPKSEKRKARNGFFGKKKKADAPPLVPQSLHRDDSNPSAVAPAPEVRERAKTSEPPSGKSFLFRMRKTSSIGKLPDSARIAPEGATLHEEKASTEVFARTSSEVLVDGAGGHQQVIPPYPTVIHRRGVAGPRIQTIVHELHEDTVPRAHPQTQYDSVELLNDRAVARTTKPLFEDGPRSELRDRAKSADNLQTDRMGKLAAEIFSFSKKKNRGNESPLASTFSLNPVLAVETSFPRAVAGSPMSASPMHAMSGGVAIRKATKPLSVTTRSPLSGGEPGEGSPSSAISTPSKEHKRTPSRNFKDWYAKYANDAIKQRLEDTSGDREFPDLITLDFIFGSKLSGPKDAVHSFAKASRCYAASRKEESWDARGPNEAPGGQRERDPAYLELLDDIAYKYRPLDVFHDGKLKGVTYSRSAHGPVLDIIIEGKKDDLLDALIFPLEQDMSYAEVFLATFRFYMLPDLLMDNLIEWYNVDIDPEATAPVSVSEEEVSPSAAGQTESPAELAIAHHRPQHETFLKKHRKHIQSRVVRVLMMWVKNHWHDFQEDGKLFRTLQAFVEHISSIGFGDGQKLSQAIREQRLSWYTTQYIPPFPAKRNHMLDNTKPWALLWESEDFAKDLTYIDHFLFRQIRPDSYLHVLARPVNKHGAGRNVPLKVLLDYVEWFRLIGSYTATTVLLEDTPKKRARAIKHMIKIAKDCRDLRNHNTLFAILWGLKRPAIAKDNQAWESLSIKHTDVFISLSALMDPADGHAAYWAEFEKARPPAIPFLGAYMRDMLEIHQAAPVYLEPPRHAEGTIALSGKARRKGGRPRAGLASDASGDESGSGAPTEIATPPVVRASEEDTSPASESINTTTPEAPTVHFQKYYDLYAAAAELEMFRVGSAMYPPSTDKDAGSLLLTHMRDMAIQKQTGLWMDDVLSEKAGLPGLTAGFLHKRQAGAEVGGHPRGDLEAATGSSPG
ncbi:hypothetical protein HKX48_006891 [Thoreauomyces humboldtii]|nr:hypothetical protein HKX48_006891 [Thoreauomyces humboldtii]